MKEKARPSRNEGGLGRREFLLLTSSCAAATLALAAVVVVHARLRRVVPTDQPDARHSALPAEAGTSGRT